MLTYKFYPLASRSAKDAHREFICADDDAAMELAFKMALGAESVEVWQGARMVGRALSQKDGGPST